MTKHKVLIVCTHLRPGRLKRRSSYVMQTLSGLHIASLIDPLQFDIRLHHEDWHGPYDTAKPEPFQLVLLTGLQPDFDRMRQLAYHFKRQGALVVAGGSVCTLFPEFAVRFFDVVCAGGVECVVDVVADYLRGRPKPIYRSAIARIRAFPVNYAHFARNGVNPSMHLIESSRGCSFKCTFCTMPSEVGAHAVHSLTALRRSLDSALATAPLLSFRRWWPVVLLLDNNFSDNRAHMLAVCDLLRTNRKIRGWGALVTQNVLRDRQLIRRLAESKCNGLFVGVESLDHELLRRHNKTQNLGKTNVVDDILFAESLGIGVTYGLLFDPEHQTAQQMTAQISEIAAHPLLPMPTYISLIAPLAGTAKFWSDIQSRKLAANLRLRDLDGETLAYARIADEPAQVVDFAERIFRRPWEIVRRRQILLKTLRRIARSGTLNPIRWFFIASANLHCFVWSTAELSVKRNYRAGEEVLDPQYSEFPDDISDEDRQRYFEPIRLTDGAGEPAMWLVPYLAEHTSAARASLAIPAP